jgi:hypothetical protein
MDDTYASPFVDPAELRSLRVQIAETGFQEDPLVGAEGARRFAGLNITLAWPLPAPFRSEYEALAADLRGLDPGLYVYPYATTHVTVVTAVSFKRHVDPAPELETAVNDAASALGVFLSEAAAVMSPFVIDVGFPVLARAAAFLPILNPTGEVVRLRREALALCRKTGGIMADAVAPGVIHSTILRFRERPRDAAAFCSAFDRITSRFTLGKAIIDELVVTLEPKPYMRDGRATHRVRLGEPR